MADALSPTYRVLPTDPESYQCLLCDHAATDTELFTLHMQQRHAGWMLREPPPGEPTGMPPAAEPEPQTAPGEPVPVPDEDEEPHAPVPAPEEG